MVTTGTQARQTALLLQVGSRAFASPWGWKWKYVQRRSQITLLSVAREREIQREKNREKERATAGARERAVEDAERILFPDGSRGCTKKIHLHGAYVLHSLANRT